MKDFKTKALLAAGGVGLLAACSSAYAATGGSGTARLSDADLNTTVAAIQADTVALQEATQPLVVECMDKLGFVYVPGDENNGMSGSQEEQDAYSDALLGTKRVSYEGLGGLSGTHPANGCVADARAAVAGSLDAFVDLATARREIEVLVVYVQDDASARAVSFDEAARADFVRSSLGGVIERWQGARDEGVAALVDG